MNFLQVVDKGYLPTNQVNGRTEGEEAAAAIEDSIREAEQEVQKAEAAATAVVAPLETETKTKDEIEVRNVVCLATDRAEWGFLS